LVFLLALAMMWAAAADTTVAGPASALTKSGDGSLILGGSGGKAAASEKKDTLHTMLSREVQVYIFRGNTRVWPRPYAFGQTQFYRSPGRYQPLAGPYLESLIQKYANQHGVDASLVRAVMRHESGFNPHAVSPKGAQGLMQLMPGTAALMGVQNPFDPEQNIAGGVGYLRYCLDQFQQSVPLAVAAYNAGPARVAKSGGVPTIPETQTFVNNVMGTYGGRTPTPTPAPPPESAKTVTKPLNTKVLPAPPKTTSAKVDGKQTDSRPRPKIIEVRYPKTKRVVAAKPKDAE